MKKLFALTLFLCFALTAEASTTVEFLSSELGGTVGPYNLTINGVPILGTCITDNYSVYTDESWQATETAVYYDPSDSTPLPNLVDVEAAWLVTQFPKINSANLTAITNIQDAIWDIVAGTASTGAVLALVTEAEMKSNYDTITAASGFDVLVPVPNSQTCGDGLPQSFLVQMATPEPGAIYMMLGGIGLIGMGRIVRRKRSA